MAVEKSSVFLPKDVFPLLADLAHGRDDDENVLISLAVGLFLSKTVSLARAAEIASLSLNDFIEVMTMKGLSWSEYTEDGYYQDLGTIKSLLGAADIAKA